MGWAEMGRRLTAARTLLFGLTPQGAAKTLIDDVLERLGDFDVEEAYDVLPDRAPGSGWRAVAFSGTVRDDRYVLRLVPSGIGALAAGADGVLPELPSPRGPLDAAIRFRLSPVAEGRDEFEDGAGRVWSWRPRRQRVSDTACWRRCSVGPMSSRAPAGIRAARLPKASRAGSMNSMRCLVRGVYPGHSTPRIHPSNSSCSRQGQSARRPTGDSRGVR